MYVSTLILSYGNVRAKKEFLEKNKNMLSEYNVIFANLRTIEGVSITIIPCKQNVV